MKNKHLLKIGIMVVAFAVAILAAPAKAELSDTCAANAKCAYVAECMKHPGQTLAAEADMKKLNVKPGATEAQKSDLCRMAWSLHVDRLRQQDSADRWSKVQGGVYKP